MMERDVASNRLSWAKSKSSLSDSESDSVDTVEDETEMDKHSDVKYEVWVAAPNQPFSLQGVTASTFMELDIAGQELGTFIFQVRALYMSPDPAADGVTYSGFAANQLTVSAQGSTAIFERVNDANDVASHGFMEEIWTDIYAGLSELVKPIFAILGPRR